MELHYTEIPDEYIYTRDITPRTPIQPIYQYRRRYTPVQTPAELFSFIAPEYSFTPSPQLPPGVSPGPYRLRPIRIDPEQLLPPHEGSYMAYAPTRAIRQRRANQMTILPFSAELSYISFGQPTSVTLPIPPRPSFTPPLFSYTICQAPFGPEIPLPQVSTPIRSRIPPLQFRSPAMTQYSPSQSVCISQDISSSPVIQRRCYISTSTSSSPSPIIQRRFLISSSESTSDSVPSSNICSERLSSSPVIQRRGYISTSTSDSSRDINSGRLSSSPIIQRRVPLDTSSSLETDSSSVSPIIRRPCFEIYESPGALTPSQMHESLMSTSEPYVPRATAYQASMGSPYFSDTFYTAKPESPQLPFRVAPIQFRTPDSAIVSTHIQQPFPPQQMSTPISYASPFVFRSPRFSGDSERISISSPAVQNFQAVGLNNLSAERPTLNSPELLREYTLSLQSPSMKLSPISEHVSIQPRLYHSLPAKFETTFETPTSQDVSYGSISQLTSPEPSNLWTPQRPRRISSPMISSGSASLSPYLRPRSTSQQLSPEPASLSAYLRPNILPIIPETSEPQLFRSLQAEFDSTLQSTGDQQSSQP